MASGTGPAFTKSMVVGDPRRVATVGPSTSSKSPLAPACLVSVPHSHRSAPPAERSRRSSHLPPPTKQLQQQQQQQQQQQLRQQAASCGIVRRTKLEVPSHESNEVFSFLKDAGLELYAACLLQSGFDDIETLQAIEDADMKDLGIPAVHIVRLRKKLQELQWQGASGGFEVDPDHPVVLFLEEHSLGMYARALMRSGFDDMDTLCDIEDADMKELGIPRGHALRMRKRLREYQLDQYHFAHDEAHPQVLHVPTPQLRTSPPPAARPMPTENMKTAVERSWEQVQILGTFTVGEMLYKNLFSVMPEAMQLFPTHVRTKYREWSSDEVADESNVLESPALRKLFSKFVNAVGCAVAGLHDNTKLVHMLMQLGQRHASYGVHEAHFEALGKAFKLTLAQILGPGFTQVVADAWTMAYGFMSSVMLQGIQEAVHALNAQSFSPPSVQPSFADPNLFALDDPKQLKKDEHVLGGSNGLADASAAGATTPQVVDGA